MFSLLKSIQHFNEISIHKFEKLENNFLRDPADIAGYVLGITNEIHNLGLEMIKETLELLDRMIVESLWRQENWVVDRHSQKQLITSLGTVCFGKTLFKNKHTGERKYLLDDLMKLEKHERMTDDALARLLEEAVQTSYRKGGEAVSLMAEVSKQTVKNKLHQLAFPEEKIPEEKKEVDYLYIDADEDHVSLQFRDRKGDLKKSENGSKNNTEIAKLVYIYEGIENESPISKRRCLVNPHYFSDVNKGDENIRFWDEIYRYLDHNYELSKVKKIYLNSDGGSWINAGRKRLAGVTHVLDGYHLEKSLVKLTSHMKDSRSDAKKELCEAIARKNKRDFEEVVEKLKAVLPAERDPQKLEDEKNYILSNWTAAKTRLLQKDKVLGCSAEGHVSHILSNRMSSRPMGWSSMGTKKMCNLLAYYYNDGDMLELARYQRKELPKAAGTENYNEILTSSQIIKSEKRRHGQLGKYIETISHSLSLDTKKKVYFSSHIWGL